MTLTDDERRARRADQARHASATFEEQLRKIVDPDGTLSEYEVFHGIGLLRSERIKAGLERAKGRSAKPRRTTPRHFRTFEERVLPRRRRLWAYLTDTRGSPSTRRQIMVDLSYEALATLTEDIQALVFAGYVYIEPKRVRAIHVLIPLIPPLVRDELDQLS